MDRVQGLWDSCDSKYCLSLKLGKDVGLKPGKVCLCFSKCQRKGKKQLGGDLGLKYKKHRKTSVGFVSGEKTSLVVGFRK